MNLLIEAWDAQSCLVDSTLPFPSSRPYCFCFFHLESRFYQGVRGEKNERNGMYVCYYSFHLLFNSANDFTQILIHATHALSILPMNYIPNLLHPSSYTRSLTGSHSILIQFLCEKHLYFAHSSFAFFRSALSNMLYNCLIIFQ